MRVRDWTRFLLAGLRYPGEARRRSYQLLSCNLTQAQRAQFNTYRYFTVVGCDTGRRYEIHEGGSLNVHELDASGHRVNRWCFSPQGPLPLGDILVAQKIALELFESEALAIAQCYSLQ